MSKQEDRDSFSVLKEIIDRLRDPGGCPWDRKQTHDTLKPYLIEECYEVLQALDKGAPEKLCEELGDLLLQIMLHARIYDEEGEFDIGDVCRKLTDKLIRRHPHVFGDQEAQNLREIELSWESLKQEERGDGESLLSGVPVEMPALTYSQSIQRRVASVGFDWNKEDIVTFASNAAVKGFVRDLNEEDYKDVQAVCIGKHTLATAKAYGMQAVQSDETTIAGIVKKVIEKYIN